MAKKKQKQAILNSRLQHDKHKKDFLERVVHFARVLVGPEVVGQLTVKILDRLYDIRYPNFGITTTNGKKFPKQIDDLIRLNFLHIVKMQNIETPSGAVIPMIRFMNEGLLLLHFIGDMQDHYVSDAAEIKKAFWPFLYGTEWYCNAVNSCLRAINMVEVCLTMPRQFTVRIESKELPFYDPRSRTNCARIHLYPVKMQQCIADGTKREITPVGWMREKDQFHVCHHLLQTFGLDETANSDKQLPVFIQKHALERLRERLAINEGMLFYNLFLTINNYPIKFHKQHDRVLVEYYLQEQKVGYLIFRGC